MLLVDDGIEELDHGPGIVEICGVELGRKILLNFQELHLGVIDQLNRKKQNACMLTNDDEGNRFPVMDFFHLPQYRPQTALALIGSTLGLPICSRGSQGWVGKVSNALISCLHLPPS